MNNLYLIRIESLSKNRKRFIYKIEKGYIYEYCRRIFNFREIYFEKIRLTLEGEELQPNKKVFIYSFEEFILYNLDYNVSSCLFKGEYFKNLVEILIDFETESLNIVVDNNNVDFLEKL